MPRKTVETVPPRKESPLRGKVGQGRRIPIAALIALSVRSQRRTKPRRPAEKREALKDWA